MARLDELKEQLQEVYTGKTIIDQRALSTLEDEAYRLMVSQISKGSGRRTRDWFKEIGCKLWEFSYRRFLFLSLPWSEPIWDVAIKGEVSMSTAKDIASQVKERAAKEEADGGHPDFLELTQRVLKEFLESTTAVPTNAGVRRIRKGFKEGPAENIDTGDSKQLGKQIRSLAEEFVHKRLDDKNLPEEDISEVIENFFMDVKVALDNLRNKVNYLSKVSKNRPPKVATSLARQACDCLGVQFSDLEKGKVSRKDLKARHRKLAGQLHPDRFENPDENVVAQYRSINEALNILEAYLGGHQ